MNHPTDRELELWLRSKEKLDHTETATILEHLESCQFCKERLNTLEAYYSDLEREIRQEPGKRERSITLKILQRRTKKALPGGSLIQTYEAPLEEHNRSLPVRVKNYLQQHPIGSASLTLGMVFLASLLFVAQPWKNVDDNPIYADVERNVLHVYNQEGETIWDMVIDGIPNGTTSETEKTDTTDRLIRITDIDGDSRNEVLLTGSDYESDFTADMLYCYNNDGSLRWKQTPPQAIQFGGRTHSSVLTWNILDFFVLNSSEDTARLFAASNSSWFPSVLFEVNPSDGEILQTYWHPGWIWESLIYQSDSSENERIILGATNNTYQKAALIVLDPDKISGHAPLDELYKTEDVSRAEEEHYILFQPSWMNRLFSNQLYNEVSNMRITDDGNLLFRTHEDLRKINVNSSVDVIYTLDNNFTVLEARGDASYDKLYSDLYESGELNEPLTDKYWESLKDSVLYWDEAMQSFISHSQREE